MCPDSRPPGALVFDTGPLSALARADLLGVLKAVVGKRRTIIPREVANELRRGTHHDYRIRAVLDAPWIEQRELTAEPELAAFARFARRLVVGERNIGEASVLAVAATLPAVAVIDDNVAFKIGKDSGVACTRTLRLLCDAVRRDLLTVDLVSDIADDLIATEYRLPFAAGEFARWADEQRLFPHL